MSGILDDQHSRDNNSSDNAAGSNIGNLDLQDPIKLSGQLIDIPSVSHQENCIATKVYAALRQLNHLDVSRYGNTVVARTDFGNSERVILAGHLDTVPEADNIPHSMGEGTIAGLGAVDMKCGDAIFLCLADSLRTAKYDITYIFYDCEEVESYHNGLGKLYAQAPELFQVQLAIIGEPSNGIIEAGCQGSLRGMVRSHGTRAHAARSWLGDNAIHHLSPIMQIFYDYRGREVTIADCHYREGLNIVGISGGIAGNVIPDAAELQFNFRFAPDRDAAQAKEFISALLLPHLNPNDELIITDIAGGAKPLPHTPITQELISAAQGKIQAKHGWTDVARFAALNIPAVNLGPGDPMLAHKPHEFVNIAQIQQVKKILESFLTH